MLGLCTFNLFVSCCFLLRSPEHGGRYGGIKTLVTLVSNILLLARRVVLNARISNLSAQEDLALSLYQLKFRSFNDLHATKKKKFKSFDLGERPEGGARGGMSEEEMLMSPALSVQLAVLGRVASGAGEGGVGGLASPRGRAAEGGPPATPAPAKLDARFGETPLPPAPPLPPPRPKGGSRSVSPLPRRGSGEGAGVGETEKPTRGEALLARASTPA